MRGETTRWTVLAAIAAIGCASRQPPAVVAIAGPPPEPVAVVAVKAPAPAPPPPVAAAPSTPEEAQTEPSPAETAEAAPPNGPRAWLGVELEAAAPDEAGVRIGRVVPKSPAESAGLLAGDLVVRIDTEPVLAPPDVVGAVSHRQPGARVGVALTRQGAERLVAVTLGAAPDRDQIVRMSFVDRPAPPLEGLATAKGSFTPTLRAQRGQVLVVEFWAPWCVACRALIPHMNQWHAQFAARGLRVVGITGDPIARAAAAAGELGMEYPVLSDESGLTIKAYDAHAIPAVFVIDKAGTVRDVMIGYDTVHLPKLDLLVQRLIAER